MERNQQIKERILWACGLINKARDGTVNILKESTIANIRSIERNSRSVKDPNPLMSTMTNINMKFPITFKPDRINTEIIPPHLFSGVPDNRRRGRILCKTDMIQWYVDNIDSNEGKSGSIIKLFDSSADKFKKVFDYPWESVTFKIGNVALTRSLVPVNPNEIDIPKEFIKPAILQTLNLDNMIEYVDIPDYYLDQVKTILRNSNLDIRSLPNILNYIISQMDKRFRFLPVIHGLNPYFVYISHALVQPQYRASSLLADSSRSTGQNKSVTELCINLIYFCRLNGIPFYRLREMIVNFTFYGYPIQKIMQSTDENKYTRFVKGCMGLEITPVIEKPSIKFYPKQSKLFETTHMTKSGLEFRRYNGEEIVFFESSTSKGMFIHNADALLTITINRTSLKNLAFVLGQIAVFITKGFDYSTSPTIKSMKASIAKLFTQKWWLVVGMTENTIRSIKQEIESGEGDVSLGALRFSDSIEIEYPSSEKCIVKDETLIGEKSGQPICIAPFVAEMVSLDFNIRTNEPKLYSILNPKRQLIKAIQYNLSVIGKIKANIKLNQFSSPFYHQLIKYVPFSMQEKTSEILKDILKAKVDVPGQNDLFISIFYNFTYGGTRKSLPTDIQKIFFAKEYLHFDLKEGIVVVSNDGSLFCGNELIVSVTKNLKEENESVCALLPNFTIRKINKLIKGIDTHSIAWLNDNSDKLPEGYRAHTLFQTGMFEVRKTSMIKIQTLKTLKRHIKIGIEEDTSNEFSRYLLKRKIEEISGSSSSDSGSKRAKLSDVSSVI